MKKTQFTIWLAMCMLLYPYRIGHTQESKMIPEKRSILDALEQKKQKLFEIAFLNQDTVQDLIAKKKPKTVILEKIKYIKIYKTVPIYVPESQALYYEPGDTLENDYLIPPPIKPKPIQHAKRKKFLGIF